MGSDHYAHFMDRQGAKVDRTRELARFRFRLRWWIITVTVATVLFTLLLVIGELT